MDLEVVVQERDQEVVVDPSRNWMVVDKAAAMETSHLLSAAWSVVLHYVDCCQGPAWLWLVEEVLETLVVDARTCRWSWFLLEELEVEVVVVNELLVWMVEDDLDVVVVCVSVE